MLKGATSVHFETLEANYHVADVIAVAFGNEKEVFVTDLNTAVSSEAFKKWLADASIEKHLFDTKAAKVLAHRFGLVLEGANMMCPFLRI